MWLMLLAPVVVVAIVSVIGVLRSAPKIGGRDPAGLRTVVVWRDAPLVAADVAGEAHEQLRQLVGELAEKRFIFAASIDRLPGADGSLGRVDVRDGRLEVRVRSFSGGRWLMWIDQRGEAPEDSEDLRQLLTGLYRTLESRGAEQPAWYRRERFAPGKQGAPSPFYVD